MQLGGRDTTAAILRQRDAVGHGWTRHNGDYFDGTRCCWVGDTMATILTERDAAVDIVSHYYNMIFPLCGRELGFKRLINWSSLKNSPRDDR